MWSVTVFILLTLIFLFCVYNCVKPKHYPPGPAWLPILGCFLPLRRLCLKHGYVYRAINELVDEYGPILGLKLGNQHLIVISSYDTVKEALLQNDLNGRPDGFFYRLRSFGKRKGILFTDGKTWSQHRKFTMQHLRMFGIGREVLRNQLSFQAQELVSYLERMSKHGPVRMNNAFDIAVLNALWFMFAGRVFSYDDEKVKTTLVMVHQAFKTIDNMGGMVTLLPFLRFIAPELSGYNNTMRILKALWSFLEEEIEMHEKQLTDEPQDLIDAFLLEIAKSNGQEDTIFDRENLLILCLDLFLAGSETTANSLGHAFLYLGLNTEWVKILQDELDDVVGKSRTPVESDLPSLPKMESFLAEILRYLILAPLGVPHRAIRDVSLNGYQIPKDSVILFNFYSAHRDEKYWDNPYEFRPQRFLDKEGKFCQKNSIIFGLGKRRCLGELLARSSLFLFFSHIVQSFDIELSADHPTPDLKGYDGFSISPKEYYLKLTKRSGLTY